MGERETLWFIAFLVQGNGRNVMVNTGPPRDLAEINAQWVEGFGFPEAARRGCVLDTLLRGHVGFGEKREGTG